MSGFFSYLFGINQKPASRVRRHLSRANLEQIIRLKTLKSVTLEEKKQIIDALCSACDWHGNISLHHIDETLSTLEQKKHISEHDRRGVREAIEAHFQQKEISQTPGKAEATL